LGAAISITAFPTLARIISETRLAGTSMGTISLAAGSLDDVVAWITLAVVIAIFSNDRSIAFRALFGGIIYATIVLTVIRKILQSINDRIETSMPKNRRYEIPELFFGSIIILLMTVATITDSLGIYAVFGAFLLGMAMPTGKCREKLKEKIEPLAVQLFLPLFFVSSGLNTKFDLLFNGPIIGIALIVLIAAIGGKYVACGLAAFSMGESAKSSMCIGILMNVRGLMELILLNIGLDRGLITQSLFTILVFMAIVTTLMAMPIFNFIHRRMKPEEILT
jgi:Kef-type K+ transport system membrane component KefB